MTLFFWIVAFALNLSIVILSMMLRHVGCRSGRFGWWSNAGLIAMALSGLFAMGRLCVGQECLTLEQLVRAAATSGLLAWAVRQFAQEAMELRRLSAWF